MKKKLSKASFIIEDEKPRPPQGAKIREYLCSFDAKGHMHELGFEHEGRHYIAKNPRISQVYVSSSVCASSITVEIGQFIISNPPKAKKKRGAA